MKKILLILGVMALATNMAFAEYEGWNTDFEKAKKSAAEAKKPLFAVFSGTDWCSWCIKLHEEVFAKDEFINYAKNNLVLFLADFPRTRRLSEELAKQNNSLAEKYGVEGFPTVLLLDAEGKQIASTGYVKGGAANYVEHIKKLIAKDESNKDNKKRI